jgi:hypothetical protein
MKPQTEKPWGMSVEEMATRKKQRQNLEVTGNKQINSFAILNNIADNTLVQTTIDLEINLTSDDEGRVNQITAIKAEERVRACIAEAAYQAHLDNLKLKESIQEDDVLDLTLIDNTREVSMKFLILRTTPVQKAQTVRRGAKRRRRNEDDVLEY